MALLSLEDDLETRMMRQAFSKRIVNIPVVIFAVLILGYTLWWVMWNVPAPLSRQVGVTWNGLTIGQSMKDEVITRIGKPHKEETLSGLVIYDYTKYKLAFNRNVLVEIVVNALELPDDDPERYLSKYVDLYGVPDFVSWTSELRASIGRRTLIFLDDGVLVVATVANDPDQSFVEEAVYYQSCPLECVEQKYTFYFRGNPPNPEFGNLPTSESTRDPWGFTK